jgi:type IV pilus assembly protein PilO
MADQNALTKLPLGGQLLVAGLVAALIVGGFWWFYWSPKKQEEQQKTAQLETLRKEIQSLEVTASKLQAFTQKLADLERQLDQLKQILPAAKEMPNLIRRLQALASESSLKITTFTPGRQVRKEFSSAPPPARPGAPAQPPASQDYYEEWPINIGLEGTYHNLGFFFDKVALLQRLVNVGNVSIKNKPKQTITSTITVTAVATTYVYVEGSAR